MTPRDAAGLDGVDLLDASVTAQLGTDWSAVRAFAGCCAAVLTGAIVGACTAGPVGVIVGAGLVAAVLFIAAHMASWRRTRRADRLLASGSDAYASTPTTGPTSPVGWLWVCGPCRSRSILVPTTGEAADLAGTHDRLHHGGTATANVAPAVVAARAGAVRPFLGLAEHGGALGSGVVA